MTSMTLDPPLTNTLSSAPELVAGVDTHKNTHHVAILDLVGRPIADREFRQAAAAMPRSSHSSTSTAMSSASVLRAPVPMGLVSPAH